MFSLCRHVAPKQRYRDVVLGLAGRYIDISHFPSLRFGVATGLSAAKDRNDGNRIGDGAVRYLSPGVVSSPYGRRFERPVARPSDE